MDYTNNYLGYRNDFTFAFSYFFEGEMEIKKPAIAPLSIFCVNGRKGESFISDFTFCLHFEFCRRKNNERVVRRPSASRDWISSGLLNDLSIVTQ